MSMSNLISFFSKSGQKKKTEPVKQSKYDNLSASYYSYYSRLEKSSGSAKCGLIRKPNGESSSIYEGFSVLDMNIQSEVYDTCCTTVLTQKYSNTLKSPVEAKYQLPLPSYAAVSNFVIEYDGQHFSGKIKEKEKAQNKYSDQIASGGQAFLGEKSSDGYFTINIGNLPPGKDVTITCTVVSEIGNHLDSFHFCLHKFMFPPGTYNFNFSLKVNLSVPIKEIEVVNNNKVKSTFSQDRNQATLNIESKSGYTESIIAVITPELNQLPAYYIEKKDSTIAASINFYPKLETSSDEVDQKSEFIFLLDCSGSMSGSAISQAKKALQIIMRSLTENHKFNIYTFGSGFKKLFPQSQIYDDTSLESASSHINKIDANMGGTELLAPMKDILSASYDPEYPRQVFILTDGEVSDRDTLIDYVGRESNTTRVFTLGIGSGVDMALVSGLSKACKGYYEFINDNKTMETNVLKLLAIAFEPTISNIKLNFENLPQGCTGIQAPTFVRPLYSGERMILSCLLEGVPEGTNTIDVTLTGNGPTGQVVTYPVQLNLTNQSTNRLDGTSYIHQLTALNMINDLEELERKTKGLSNQEKIIKLSKQYGIVSKYTAFIVTIDSNDTTQETMTNVLVQDKSTHSGGGVDFLLANTLQNRRSSLSSRESDYDDGESDGSSSNGSEDETLEYSKPQITHTVQSAPLRKGFNMKSRSVKYDDHDDDELMEEECEKKCEKDYDMEGSTTTFKDKKSKPQMKLKKKSSPPPPSSSPFTSSSSSSSSSSIPPSPKTTSKLLSSVSPVSSGKKLSTGDLLLDLIQAQKANGSWTSDSLSFSVPTAPSDLSSLDATVFTTLIVISKIVNNYPNDSAKWDLIIKKATKWVKAQLAKSNFTTIPFDDLLKKCKSLAK